MPFERVRDRYGEITGHQLTTKNPTPALFVTNRTMLSGLTGGGSLFTKEYMAVLAATGFDLEVFAYDADRSLGARVRRRLLNRPYENLISAETIRSLANRASETDRNWIFLNFWDAAAFAPSLREMLPDARIIHVSAGPESVDYLHELRSRDLNSPFRGTTVAHEKRLARQLIQECKQRLAMDDVLSLSAVEAEFEKWLGVPRVTWVPRTVTSDGLDWNPVRGRIGFVGSLSHPPNTEGILSVCEELKRRGQPIEFRLVGGPTHLADRFVKQYSFLHYCGRLSDSELRQEASTWTCFLNPVFCYARGATTKLAVGLGWEIPIVTTTPGVRGYRWANGQLLVGDTARAFVDRILSVTHDASEMNAAREQVRAIVRSSPTITDVAAELSSFFCLGQRD